ncbi:MAG: FAD-dependent oxidoreductase [Pseudomonadota bacterium]
MPQVLIVGAGITGLCTAWALARGGVGVTVVEKGPVPCPTAASADHHRLIRRAYPAQPGYALRTADAFAAWERLFADLPRPRGHYFADNGILSLSLHPGDRGDRVRRSYDRLAIPYEAVDGRAALAERFPFLETRNLAGGVVSAGGALMANRILTDLADHLRARGVQVLEHSPVAAVEPQAPAVRLADGRHLTADRVIVAAGAGAPGLMPAQAGDLGYRRTLIAYATPPKDLADAWEGAPCWSGLGAPGELWGMSPVHGLPLKLGCGALGRIDPDDSDRTPTAAEIDGIFGFYRGLFRGIERFTLRFAQANFWMLAAEEKFVLRAEGGCLLLSADSGHGFKFGPLTGEDVAEAALGAMPVAEVAARMAAPDPV